MSLKKYTLTCLIVLFSTMFFYYTPVDAAGGEVPEEDPSGEVVFDFLGMIYRGQALFAGDKEKTARPEPAPGIEISLPSEESMPPHPAKVAAAESSGGSGVSLSRSEQQMLSLINQTRNSAGLPSLQVCSRTTAAARAKSRDMAQNNYFSHTSPTYGRFTGLLNHYGSSYRTAAENIAWNTSGSASAAHNSFMGSPGHRRNILGGNFNFVGVGVYSSGGRTYYTQLFVGR